MSKEITGVQNEADAGSPEPVPPREALEITLSEQTSPIVVDEPGSDVIRAAGKEHIAGEPRVVTPTTDKASTGTDKLNVRPKPPTGAKSGQTPAPPSVESTDKKNLAPEPVKIASKSSEAIKELPKVSNRETSKDSSRGSTKDLSPDVSMNLAKETLRDPSKTLAMDAAKESQRVLAKETTKDTSKSPSKEQVADPSKDPNADKRRRAAVAKPKPSPVGEGLDKKLQRPEPAADAPFAKSVVSPLTYNAELADRAVRAKNLLTDERFAKMARTLMRFSLEFAADRVMQPKRKDDIESRKRGARRLRQALEDLGPTFIKLGQFLSVRRDCLSPEMAEELAVLQDKVPPFAFDLVRKSVASELGAPPEQIFESIEEKPIASASIGQVHKAVLKDGRPVVIKVQRPDLARLFYQDLGCMRMLAKWGVLLRPEGQWQSWIELSDEFGKNLFQELNYIEEGKNADRVRVMLKDQPAVQVPRVYWKSTGRRVLTLEYCPGIKIDKVKELGQKGYNLPKIANQLVSTYLEMVLMHGFFHADPHAGNLSIAPDGRIIIYDFGMMGEITEANKESITGCIAAVIKKDTDELVKNLVSLGIVEKDAQLEPIKRTVQPFIDYYAGKPMMSLDFTDLEHDIDSIAEGRSLTLPPTLAYLLRAGSSLEGIARTLIPDFSFVEAAKPPLRRWVMSRPHYAASLVKVFIEGNLSIGHDAFLKLTPGKQPDAPAKATKDDKSKKNPAKMSATAPAAPAASFEELSEVRARIVQLENQVKEQSKQGYLLAAVAVWLVFSTAASFVRECDPYVHYFLIGNGVMGAIIMWHLVTHLRPVSGQKKKAVQRGNGDKRC